MQKNKGKQKKDILPENIKDKKENRALKLVREFREKQAINAAEQDVIFSEPISGVPEEKPVAFHRGNIDVWFLIIALMLICLGVVMSYSASAVFAENRYDDSLFFLKSYIKYALVGVVASVPCIIWFRPRVWKLFGVASYIGAVILLILVLVIGRTGGAIDAAGAQRWIALGPITIQPSEIAKTAVVLVLALYMAKYERDIIADHKVGGTFKYGFFIPMIIIGILCALIALQPHLSGLMIVGMIGVMIMFLGGTRMKWLFIFLGIILVAGVAFILLFGYTMERVEIWLNIDEVDPLGNAWQTLQGLYAIGSGGFFGVGLGASRQKFGYVSQPQNDFIFTIICEELGFVGAFLVVFLFALLVWRGIKIGQRAPDKFSALVIWGLTFKIALQVVMNIAVVTNSMPNTGISLPFFSSGGTALILQIFEVGIILSLSRFSVQKQ